ncbi:MAG: hypothetical protein ABI528_11540 [bacterium]
MKYLRITLASNALLSILIIYLVFDTHLKSYGNGKINSVTGDISYILKYGHTPGPESDENDRIITHLNYVEDLLRQTDISDMPEVTQQNRIRVLDLLHEYTSAGQFPVNYDHNERRPCFIDKNGNICAVGYLIEKTADRSSAEYINTIYQYDLIDDMDDKFLSEWIGKSGLNKTECAMIQPTYNPYKNGVTSENAFLSATLSVANLTLDLINGIEISKKVKGNVTPYLGIISGSSQIVHGILNYPEKSNKNQKCARTLSIANIGIGASAVIMGVWNILNPRSQEKDKVESKTTWNIYSLPGKENELSMGISVIHNF